MTEFTVMRNLTMNDKIIVTNTAIIINDYHRNNVKKLDLLKINYKGMR